MSLIIALVLLFYFVGRISVEESDARAVKKRREASTKETFERRDKFITKYKDEDLEDELRELCVKTNENYQRIEGLLNENGLDAYPGRVLMIWMAEYQKIPEKYLNKGIKNIIFPLDTPKKERIAEAEDHWKFIKYYANYCKQNGIDEPLYFSPNVGYTKHERWELDDSANHAITHNGVFLWEPIDVCYPSGSCVNINKR